MATEKWINTRKFRKPRTFEFINAVLTSCGYTLAQYTDDILTFRRGTNERIEFTRA